MIKKMQWNWEQLDEGTRRTKVIGGWLINTHRRCDNGKLSSFDQALVFVSDPDHQWVIVPPMPDLKAEKVSLAKDFEALKDDPKN